MSSACMLTTKDNPYSYYDDFDNWYMYDISHGYNTCSLLARISTTSESLTDEENNKEIEKACDSIIKTDLTQMYKKVYSSIDEELTQLGQKNNPK